MEGREAGLARTVAITLDAWLRDPRDAALYVRLLTAVEAWRAHVDNRPEAAPAIDQAPTQSDGALGAERDGVSPVAASTATAALLEKLRRIQADAHRREHSAAAEELEPPQSSDAGPESG